MPVKLKKSQKIQNRSSGKMTTEHFYLKCMSLEQLKTIVKTANTRPKVKIKCLNEINKRKDK